MLPTGWAAVATPWLIGGSLFTAFLLAGVPLLWAHLRYRPITRNMWLHAAWMLVGGTTWLTVGNGAKAAYESGLISLATTIVTVGLIFLIACGGSLLLERLYPEEKQS